MSGDFQKVAVIGGGLIGASWAALFLAHGLDVTVQDPAEGFETRVKEAVQSAWPDLCALGVSDESPPFERLHFAADIAAACRGAEFVQECGPDRIEVKRVILAEIEAVLDPAVVVASSTSALLASDIQAEALYPGRVLVGHPFNPPHLIPLVEIVRGSATSDAAVALAKAFYDRLNREVILVQKEVIGHIANRLSAALFREAVHLVADGIASVEDVDRAVSFGPGLRWALMGPHLTYHLGGGAGGYRGYMEHLGPTQVARWAELGAPNLDAETIAALTAGVDEELAMMDADTLAEKRDKGLIGLLALKKEIGLSK